MRTIVLLLVLVISGVISITGAQSETAPGTDSPERMAAESSRLFQEAAETIDSDRAGAIDRIERSIDLLESLISRHGIENASIHYNIANAYALAERYGRAIEHYRRALALDPTDAEVLANLEYARSRVPDRLGAAFEPSMTRRALDVVPSSQRLWGLLLVLVTIWGLLITRAALAERTRRERGADELDERVRPAVPLLPVFATGAIAAVLALTLAMDALWPRPTFGVVADAPAMARQGPSEAAYDPAFERPLSPGVEFRVLEIRDGIDAPGEWVLAEFGDSRRGWFRRGSVVLVGRD
jgi:hypothetical protein